MTDERWPGLTLEWFPNLPAADGEIDRCLMSFSFREKMPMTESAILVSPGSEGWTWELIDSFGLTIATGVAACQASAMETAWLMAKASADFGAAAYPDIKVLPGDLAAA